MDNDVLRSMRQAAARPSQDLSSGATGTFDPEWDGTGLCAEAQADGVPCHEVGRSCDVCGRARSRISGAHPGTEPSSKGQPADRS
jgi:hypothetical protein